MAARTLPTRESKSRDDGRVGGGSTLPIRLELLPARVRARLRQAGVPLIRIVGPPGAGKTALLEATLKRLKGRRRVAVIVANPAADHDANILRLHSTQVRVMNVAVPDPAAVTKAVESIDLATVDLIVLEACGGITPFPDVGENAIVAVLGVSGGGR